MLYRWLTVAAILSALGGSADGARGQYYDPNCPQGNCPLQQPADPYGGWRAAPVQDEAAYQHIPFAQPSPAITQAVVRLRIIDKHQPNPGIVNSNIGSGTLVESRAGSGMVLTCAHIFKADAGPIEAYLADGRSTQATLIDIDAFSDLAAVDISGMSAQPVQLADQEPKQSESCVSGGYGKEGRAEFRSGPFIQICGVEKHGQMLEIRGTSRPGDSGGPIFNSRWQLCGVVHGTNFSPQQPLVYGPHCGLVRRFLERARSRWLARHPQQANTAPLPGPLPYPPMSEVTPGAPNITVQTPAGPPPAIAQPANPPAANQTSPIVDRIENKVEGAATKAGTAWLTPILIGLGIPAGPAGWAASAVASAAIGFIGWKAKGWWANRKPSLPVQLPHIVSDALQQSPVVAEVARVIHQAPDPARTYVEERHHNQYIEVPKSNTDKAWASAHAIYGSKYPGATNTLKAVEKLKEQILKGEMLPTQ